MINNYNTYGIDKKNNYKLTGSMTDVTFLEQVFGIRQLIEILELF